ncbi:MAG TPA: ABC transporter permease [Solirubrobacteraceae bacterium]
MASLGRHQARRGHGTWSRDLERWIAERGIYSRLASAGGMGALFIASARLAVRWPLVWWRDAVIEASLAIRRCWFALFIASSAFAIALIGVYGGNVLQLLGARDRIGGPGFIAAIREPSAWATMMIFAGVAGSAITADLGARRIRDELDALAVLGVDTIRALVVPRIVGLALIAPVLGMLSLAVTVGELYLLAPAFLDVSRASYIESLSLAIYPVDLIAFFVKFALVGLVVGVVSSYKGLTTGGGAEGVGRAVNSTVVITFFTLWALSVVFNTGYLSLFPDVTTQRG